MPKSIKLCFELSMPNVGSWNGKWSGRDNYYAIVRSSSCSKKSVEKFERIANEGYYHYNFGDGWSAGVTVKKVEGPEVRKIKKNSRGFCGYDWMVDSILENGTIKT
jgi:hypothetical protein